jgi:hypothetical protein
MHHVYEILCPIHDMAVYYGVTNRIGRFSTHLNRVKRSEFGRIDHHRADLYLYLAQAMAKCSSPVRIRSISWYEDRAEAHRTERRLISVHHDRYYGQVPLFNTVHAEVSKPRLVSVRSITVDDVGWKAELR